MAEKLVSFRTAIKYRDLLFTRLAPYVGTTIVGQTFKDFFDDVYDVLPKSVSHDAVFESIRLLAGTQFDRKSAAAFCWRMGGNIHTLIGGGVVVPWTRQVRDEWVPIQIDSLEPFMRKNKAGYLFHCIVVAGSPCPVKFSQFVSRAACFAIGRSSGFTSRRGRMPFVYPEYLTKLIFYGLIDAQRSEEKPYFTKVRNSSAAVTHNRQILDIRYRLQPCPRDYQHDCKQCILGYDACMAAIRPQRLQLMMCSVCNKETYFEQRSVGLVCLACNRQSDCHLGRNTHS